MDVKSLNCWEFKGCGREPGGKNVALYGVCVAATETSLDGTHNGRNCGRCCWVVASSYCPFVGADPVVKKCRKCDFYHLVKASSKLLVMA
ncbi:MAG: hypothetical protein D3909_14565 [Candidatus Electrothrix sp. ATG1]|nr:hypothetical protein [Candidatus Electrothrix sp. ATG1]